eukprot:scaffold154375_cov33-Tisochrysis_lutea.AAC.1
MYVVHPADHGLGFDPLVDIRRSPETGGAGVPTESPFLCHALPSIILLLPSNSTNSHPRPHLSLLYPPTTTTRTNLVWSSWYSKLACEAASKKTF